MKFELKVTDAGPESVTTTKEFDTDTWFTALDEFMKLLKGSGFSIHRDSVGINTQWHTVKKDELNTVTTFESNENFYDTH